MSNNDFGVFCGNGLNGGNYSFEFLGYKGQCTPNGFTYTFDLNSTITQAAPSFQLAPSHPGLTVGLKGSGLPCPIGCCLCSVKPPWDRCPRDFCCECANVQRSQPVPSFQPAPSLQPPQKIFCPVGCHVCPLKPPNDVCLIAHCCTDDFKPSSPCSSKVGALHQAVPSYQPAPSYQQAQSVAAPKQGQPCPDGCYLCAKKDPEDPCPIDMCCSLPR